MIDEVQIDKKNWTMRLFTTLVIVCFCSFVALANEAAFQSLFQQGNEWYKKGEYNKAIQVYSKIQDQNHMSYTLFFNMGNAYYKLHQYGQAILQYERAKKYFSNTQELEHNLALCKKNIIDKQGDSSFRFQWHFGLPSLFSEAQWAWLTIVFMILLMIPVFLILRAESPHTRKWWFNVGVFVFLMLFFSLLFGFLRKTELSLSNQAIVMAQTAQIQSEPMNSAKEVFVLHEGTKVSILRREGDWINISISNGNEGWCHSSVLEEI